MKKNLLFVFVMFVFFICKNATATQNKIQNFSDNLSIITKQMSEATAASFVIGEKGIKKAEETIKAIEAKPDTIVKIASELPSNGYSCCLLYSANNPFYGHIFNALMRAEFGNGFLLANTLVNAANSTTYDVAFNKLMSYEKVIGYLVEALMISANNSNFDTAYEKLMDSSLASDTCVGAAIIVSKSESPIDYSTAFRKLISHERVNNAILVYLVSETFTKSLEDMGCGSAFIAVLLHEKVTRVTVLRALFDGKSEEEKKEVFNTLERCKVPQGLSPKEEEIIKTKLPYTDTQNDVAGDPPAKRR